MDKAIIDFLPLTEFPGWATVIGNGTENFMMLLQWSGVTGTPPSPVTLRVGLGAVLIHATDGTLYQNQANNGQPAQWKQIGGNSFVSSIVDETTIDLNITTDQELSVNTPSSLRSISTFIVFNSSVDLSLVDDVEIWTAPGRTGILLMTISNGTSTIQGGWTALVTSADLITGLLPRSKIFSQPTLYFSVGTPQGSAATATISLAGYKLS